MYIDNKIESVMRLAVEETDDQCATHQVFEFLDMIIEEVEAMRFLSLRLPLQCGEHFWRAYRDRVEEEMQMVLGVERIYRAIRGGFGEMPRRRDYSLTHRFKTLPLSALEDTQKRWESHCDVLREACEAVKGIVRAQAGSVTAVGEVFSGSSQRFSIMQSSELIEDTEEVVTFAPLETTITEDGTVGWIQVAEISTSDGVVCAPNDQNVQLTADEVDFLKAVIPVIKLTHTIFKKVKLRYLGPDCPMLPSEKRSSPRRLQVDDLLEASEHLPAVVAKLVDGLLNPPHNHAVICAELGQLVGITLQVCELVKEYMSDPMHMKWFELAERQLEAFLDTVLEMNPSR